MSVFLFGISSFWGWSRRLSYTGIEVQQPNAFFLTTLINMPNQNKSIHPSMFLLFLLKTAICLWATSDFSPFRCNPLSLRANIPSPTLSLFFFPRLPHPHLLSLSLIPFPLSLWENKSTLCWEFGHGVLCDSSPFNREWLCYSSFIIFTFVDVLCFILPCLSRF